MTAALLPFSNLLPAAGVLPPAAGADGAGDGFAAALRAQQRVGTAPLEAAAGQQALLAALVPGVPPVAALSTVLPDPGGTARGGEGAGPAHPGLPGSGPSLPLDGKGLPPGLVDLPWPPAIEPQRQPAASAERGGANRQAPEPAIAARTGEAAALATRVPAQTALEALARPVATDTAP